MAPCRGQGAGRQVLIFVWVLLSAHEKHVLKVVSDALHVSKVGETPYANCESRSRFFRLLRFIALVALVALVVLVTLIVLVALALVIAFPCMGPAVVSFGLDALIVHK